MQLFVGGAKRNRICGKRFAMVDFRVRFSTEHGGQKVRHIFRQEADRAGGNASRGVRLGIHPNDQVTKCLLRRQEAVAISARSRHTPSSDCEGSE
jgi:acetylornithine deacetylase/succinyl-diaminopimelate desuccinylase-like protein